LKRIVTALAFVVLGAASAWAQASSAITVQQPWARATPGGASTGAVYMTLVNGSATADRLIGASTPVASQAQLHQMSMVNGVMKMRDIASFELAPGATVAIEPGKYHVMLIGLKHSLKEGDTFPLTLVFAKAGREEVQVKVAKVGAMEPDGMGAMHGMPGMPAPK
jgi:periplasmic copper chaperone A